MDKESFYKNSAIFLLANIPANLDDNDPSLIERMQAVFDQYFFDYKARFAGKSIIERLEGCTFTVPDSKDMLYDCIDEMHSKLTRFDPMTINPTQRIKLRRMLAFLAVKKARKQSDTGKSEKTFLQFIINIPENEKDRFASMLRNEFKTEIGLDIRYMIEAMKKLKILTHADHEGTKLYRSVRKYFNRNIGSRQSIFPAKSVNIYEPNIERAIDRINPLLLNIHPTF